MLPGKQNYPQLRIAAMRFLQVSNGELTGPSDVFFGSDKLDSVTPNAHVFELASAIDHQINPINTQLPYCTGQDIHLLLLC